MMTAKPYNPTLGLLEDMAKQTQRMSREVAQKANAGFMSPGVATGLKYAAWASALGVAGLATSGVIGAPVVAVASVIGSVGAGVAAHITAKMAHERAEASKEFALLASEVMQELKKAYVVIKQSGEPSDQLEYKPADLHQQDRLRQEQAQSMKQANALEYEPQRRRASVDDEVQMSSSKPFDMRL